MRIVDRTTFLALPPGTVYAKYEPFVFDQLAIKGDSINLHLSPGDWFYQDIADSIDADNTGDFVETLEQSAADGSSVRMDFYTQGRDGLYEADQLFAVWDSQDVTALIERLRRALGDAEGLPPV